MEADVGWYCRTCTSCQLRQKTLVRIRPTITETPPVFHTIHADVVHMSTTSNGCGLIVHGRCALSQWMEARALRKQNGATIGRWLFEEVITRWGCIRRIVTDNGGPFIVAVDWLREKYGITGISISGYNSQANGAIERPHWDVVNMLTKATSDDLRRWYWFLPHVMWADRITVRKRFGCSPFFMLTGAEPITPLDIQEATWLTEPPIGFTSTAELIGARARALAKHHDFVEAVREKVHEDKKKRVARYEEEHKHTIKDYNFKPGDLVLMRNTAIESSLDRKMKMRYMGPVVVIARNKGGAYIVAELDGTVHQSTIAAFRVVPYFPRQHISLPRKLYEILDMGPLELQELIKRKSKKREGPDFSFQKMPKALRPAKIREEEEEDADTEQE